MSYAPPDLFYKKKYIDFTVLTTVPEKGSPVPGAWKDICMDIVLTRKFPDMAHKGPFCDVEDRDMAHCTGNFPGIFRYFQGIFPGCGQG